MSAATTKLWKQRNKDRVLKMQREWALRTGVTKSNIRGRPHANKGRVSILGVAVSWRVYALPLPRRG